jgi:hypothetical protein
MFPVMPIAYEPTAYLTLSDDAVPALPPDETDSVVLRRVDVGVAQLVAAQEAEEKRRKVTLILTGVGVVFAAIKLGFIVVPHFRSKTT